MPTTYTHDLFGKQMYRALPGEIREVIKENGDLYRIGLHGPDILFYHFFDKRVNQLGVKMHRERAASFFEKGMEKVRESGDRALLAYLLGFGCHYLLDSACHPCVNCTAEKGVVSHTLLEKEFDRTLMLKTNKNPYTFYPSQCIKPRMAYARTIHKAIEDVKPGKALMALRMMKFSTNAMVYDNHGRRVKLIGFLLELTGEKNKKKVLDHFMTRKQSQESRACCKVLRKYYDEAVSTSPAYLRELFSLSKKEGSLSKKRWNLTYSG